MPVSTGFDFLNGTEKSYGAYGTKLRIASTMWMHEPQNNLHRIGSGVSAL
jgi:hypothetical protein